MAAKSPANSFTLSQARRLWWHKQRIKRADSSDPAAILKATGWTRTLGGIDVYLALRARNPTLTRAEVDHAVAQGDVRVVPAVRGCIYLAPSEHAPLLLNLAGSLAHKRTERDLARCGVDPSEVDALATSIQDVVRQSTCTTAEVRKALPAGAIRSLGPIGKKLGLSSLLPLALRQLEFAGQVVRTPVGTTLDTERYRWSAPVNRTRAPTFIDTTQCILQVVDHFLLWFGPATTKEMAEWIGVSQRAIKQAVEHLPTQPCSIEGHAEHAWIQTADIPRMADLPPPNAIAFLPFGDNLIHLHGGPGPMIDPRHHAVEARSWGGTRKRSALGTIKHLGYRSIFVGDQMVGLWEYDPSEQAIVCSYFDGPPKGTKIALRQAAEALTTVIRDDLGHARSFSLDTDAALHTRATELRGH